MANKIGIHIAGLGQSIENETVEKYTERLRNELSYSTTGYDYYLKAEKIFYQADKSSTVVSIIQKDKSSNKEELIYKMYEFQYHNILTDKFVQYNIFYKNFILFRLILKKIPQIFLRLFKRNGFSRPYQTFYAFFIVFLISLCVLFLIPTCIEIITNASIINQISKVLVDLNFKPIEKNTIDNFKFYGKYVLSVTTLILLLAPQTKIIITSIAADFACVDGYISNGEQSQVVLGNLNSLIDFIDEHNSNAELHFHCYSFGSVLAMDALFPVAEIPPSNNIQNITKLLITIGNPFEFINAYYPNFYDRRNTVMGDKIKWLNIYSLGDVFATNFRMDKRRGNAEFGIKNVALLPENSNYEISSDKGIDFFSVISLNSIKKHKCYWDSNTIGNSCLKLVLSSMKDKKAI